MCLKNRTKPDGIREHGIGYKVFSKFSDNTLVIGYYKSDVAFYVNDWYKARLKKLSSGYYLFTNLSSAKKFASKSNGCLYVVEYFQPRFKGTHLGVSLITAKAMKVLGLYRKGERYRKGQPPNMRKVQYDSYHSDY
jgi:hypothetical protein